MLTIICALMKLGKIVIVMFFNWTLCATFKSKNFFSYHFLYFYKSCDLNVMAICCCYYSPFPDEENWDLMKLASNEAITCNPQSFWFQSLCSHLLCYIVRLGREFWDKPAFKNDPNMWCDLASYLRVVQARTKFFCLPQPLINWGQMHPPSKVSAGTNWEYWIWSWEDVF